MSSIVSSGQIYSSILLVTTAIKLIQCVGSMTGAIMSAITKVVLSLSTGTRLGACFTGVTSADTRMWYSPLSSPRLV